MAASVRYGQCMTLQHVVGHTCSYITSPAEDGKLDLTGVLQKQRKKRSGWGRVVGSVHTTVPVLEIESTKKNTKLKFAHHVSSGHLRDDYGSLIIIDVRILVKLLRHLLFPRANFLSLFTFYFFLFSFFVGSSSRVSPLAWLRALSTHSSHHARHTYVCRLLQLQSLSNHRLHVAACLCRSEMERC